ncbi:class I SAM-dependent methyltransferase [Altererythrobacter lauratis]|uniref:Class I SAM-dependent methyltransferase n=1 Tax=Alteraurantiacibacter lauratis TaxID=2054627 RepID=A0ABV7EFD9_9SPHN
MSDLVAAHNFPTVSAPAAMRNFPHVRDNERDRLLDYVTLSPEMSVLDIQAAGGYLSDEVYRRLNGAVSLVCVEPNPELRARLNPAFRALADPVEQFASIPDHSIDLALGLIGLHHSASHRATIAETWRVLKPGGEMAICDVPRASRLASWFNEFVDAHCPAGHDGNFPEVGSMSRLAAGVGFVAITEEVRDVPWVFGERTQIATFFQGLFNLDLPCAEIDRALDSYFTIHELGDTCLVEWQLSYCHARKPGCYARDPRASAKNLQGAQYLRGGAGPSDRPRSGCGGYRHSVCALRRDWRGLSHLVPQHGWEWR